MSFEYAYVACVGLIIGSFLNVCIHRIPRGESVISPRSRCPQCSRPVRAIENVPVLSYLLLGGKCRGCGQPIGWIYPLVEILTGVGFVLLLYRFGLSTPFFVNAVLFSLLIALAFIDLFERILPNVMTLGGTVVGLLLAGLQSEVFLKGAGSVWGEGGIPSNYVNSLLGILFGGGFLWAVAALYLRIRRIEGMGFGDVKMMAMVGAFLGWQFAWLTILFGSLVGAIVGGFYIYLSKQGRRYELPFGTFLAFAAMVVVLVGPEALNWYLNRLGGS